MVTNIFIAVVFALIVIYDIIAYLVWGIPFTISTKLYDLSTSKVVGPILLFLSGALMYHLFVCPPGCG